MVGSKEGPPAMHQHISRKEQRQQRRSREEPQSQVLPEGQQLPSQHHGRVLRGSAHPSLALGLSLQWVSALLYWRSFMKQFPNTSGSPPQSCFALGSQTLTKNTTKPNSIISQAGSSFYQLYQPSIWTKDPFLRLHMFLRSCSQLWIQFSSPDSSCTGSTQLDEE